MYKLLIVDDEEIVRKAIIEKIDWESYGFTIVGEAENGKEAFEIAEKTMPDLVITDIKMPFMDGLELSQLLRLKLPTIKVVILTGFDEFEYAHKAIKVNVLEYVLKPISAHDLIEVLEKIKNTLDKEQKQKEDFQLLREHYIRSLPILKDKFLTSLVTRKLNQNDIIEKSTQYGVNLNGDSFLVSIMSIDPVQEDKTSAFTIPADLELLLFAIYNIAEEIINKRSNGIIFMHNDSIIYLEIDSNTTEDIILAEATSTLEEIRLSVEKYLRVTVTIGVGNVCSSLEDISTSLSLAINAVDYRVLLGGNKVIQINDVEPQSIDTISLDEMKQHSLISSIKVGSSDEIKENLDKLLDELIIYKAKYKDYQIYLLDILTSILKVAKDLNVNIDSIFGSNSNLFVEMYKFSTLNEIRDWLLEICLNISQYIRKERQNTSQKIINTAKEYLHKNYSDSEITIEKVSKLLHISPNYFSTIFKKETKLTFINYLTNIRMDAAKELLKNTEMKNFEIAQRVGFSEPTYFSYSFKKNFGISPSEYRNI